MTGQDLSRAARLHILFCYVHKSCLFPFRQSSDYICLRTPVDINSLTDTLRHTGTSYKWL